MRAAKFLGSSIGAGTDAAAGGAGSATGGVDSTVGEAGAAAGESDGAAGGLDSPQPAMIPITAPTRIKRCMLKVAFLPYQSFVAQHGA